MEDAQSRRRGGRAYHSVLEPHVDAIRHWRRQRKTWREIAALLAQKKGIVVTLYAPYRFMRRRLTRRTHWENPTDYAAESPSPSLLMSKSMLHPVPASSGPALPQGKFQRPDRKSFNAEDYL